MTDARHRRLLTTVARRYYLDDRSKVQIAQELGLSRFKVARLLQQSREDGVVRIEIEDPAGVDADLSDTVREQLGLRRVVVVEATQTSVGERRTAVAGAAAELLVEVLRPGDVLGLPSSRTVASMVAALRTLPAVDVVQLTGALRLGPEHDSSLDLVRESALLGGGTAHQFYAPFVAGDPDGARILRAQPDAAEATARAADVTVAVVGIGAWRTGDSSLYGLATDAEQRELKDAGAVGEVAGVFLDAAGRPLASSFADRLVTVAPERLRSIPHVIGIPFGPDRAAVVRAAVSGGFVDTVVCDADLARHLVT